MQCPSFNVTMYGVFNSSIRYPNIITTPDRVVNSYEIEFYPNSCQGMAYIDGKEYLLPEGTLTCAKPGQLFHSRFPRRCSFVCIQTDDPALTKLLDQIPEYFIPGKIPELVQIFDELLHIDAVDTIQNRLLMADCVYRLIDLLVKLHGVEVKLRTGIVDKHQKLLLDVEKYINEHLSEDLSLNTLAAQCGMCRSYFHLLFTSYFEKTPMQYILEKRILVARFMLLRNEQPLSVIAKECGFATQAYFCSKFKQVTGITPLQYRQEMLSCIKY